MLNALNAVITENTHVEYNLRELHCQRDQLSFAVTSLRRSQCTIYTICSVKIALRRS
jgi:hypothetical protein